VLPEIHPSLVLVPGRNSFVGKVLYVAWCMAVACEETTPASGLAASGQIFYPERTLPSLINTRSTVAVLVSHYNLARTRERQRAGQAAELEDPRLAMSTHV
jgi:hypothetical protein